MPSSGMRYSGTSAKLYLYFGLLWYNQGYTYSLDAIDVVSRGEEGYLSLNDKVKCSKMMNSIKCEEGGGRSLLEGTVLALSWSNSDNSQMDLVKMAGTLCKIRSNLPLPPVQV
jgi:hypothetical protein